MFTHPKTFKQLKLRLASLTVSCKKPNEKTNNKLKFAKNIIMKRILIYLLTILSLVLGGGCVKPHGQQKAEAYFTGKVVEILEDRILLEVTDKGNQNFALGEQVYASTSVANCPEIAKNDILKIEFDGCMALSLPPLVFRVYAISKVG